LRNTIFIRTRSAARTSPSSASTTSGSGCITSCATTTRPPRANSSSSASRTTFGASSSRLSKRYTRLFKKYEGKKIADDTGEYLENFARIVRLIGKSFPNTGIEILLHDLSNPSQSLVVLENNVTGRNLRDGTTSLVIDLKKRQLLHEDKLNYELNIGARRFKCTTIPIVRKEYGVVGAICINIDANYLSEDVIQDAQKVRAWFEAFCRTDMQLDENILSRDEYARALKGKRHFRDERT